MFLIAESDFNLHLNLLRTVLLGKLWFPGIFGLARNSVAYFVCISALHISANARNKQHRSKQLWQKSYLKINQLHFAVSFAFWNNG